MTVFFLFAALFWGAYEQAGSTLNLFADRYTRLSVLGRRVPLVVVPVGAADLRDPPRPGLRVALDAARPARALEPRQVRARPALHGARVPDPGAGRPAWPRAAPACASARGGSWPSYFISELGELCVSPVGLSVVTKLAPVRIVGLMMGVWFLSNALRQQAGGLGGRLLQHDAPADPLWNGGGGDPRRRPGPDRAGEARAQPDERSALAMTFKHLTENPRDQARAWNIQLGVSGFRYADLNRVRRLEALDAAPSWRRSAGRGPDARRGARGLPRGRARWSGSTSRSC